MLGLVVDDASLVRSVKVDLGLQFNKSRKITESNGRFVIPTVCRTVAEVPQHLRQYTTVDLPQPQSNESPQYAIPPRWTVYPPMVLFSSDTAEELDKIPREYLEQCLRTGAFGRRDLTHVAVNRPIPENDVVRKPGIVPIVGDFGPEPSLQSIKEPTREDFDAAFWCQAVQNGIHQVWAPRYTMFSRGNIKEKARVLSDFDSQAAIKDTTVVDLYCGIGYFVFSYAKQAPQRVLCWELNPWSVEGLSRGARLNKWNTKILGPDDEFTPQRDDLLVVFNEDNACAVRRWNDLDLAPVSHINMGLLPDSKQSYQSAMFLASHGTVLHVHENVATEDIRQWEQDTAAALSTEEKHVRHISTAKIKTFSPNVWHVCGDFITSL